MFLGGPSPVGGFAAAWAGTDAQLLSWFQGVARPKLPIDDVYDGVYGIASQSDAAALSNKLVRGYIDLTVGDVSFKNFQVDGIPGVGTSTHYNLINYNGGIDNIRFSDFKLDGMNERAYSGMGGTTYSENIFALRGEITRMGDDGGKAARNSRYRHLYIHSNRPWDEATDGPFNPDANNVIHPHPDALQFLRSGNIAEECYIDMLDDYETTSGMLGKGDTEEQLNGLTIRRCRLGGGGRYTIHIVEAASGKPLNIVITDNRFSRAYGGYPNNGPISHGTVDPGQITLSNNVWVDDGTAIIA